MEASICTSSPAHSRRGRRLRCCSRRRRRCHRPSAMSQRRRVWGQTIELPHRRGSRLARVGPKSAIVQAVGIEDPGFLVGRASGLVVGRLAAQAVDEDSRRRRLRACAGCRRTLADGEFEQMGCLGLGAFPGRRTPLHHLQDIAFLLTHRVSGLSLSTSVDMVPPWPDQGGHFYRVKTGHSYCRSTGARRIGCVNGFWRTWHAPPRISSGATRRIVLRTPMDEPPHRSIRSYFRRDGQRDRSP